MRGPVPDGVALLNALRPFQDQAFQAARLAGRQEPAAAHAFDGLINLARSTTDTPTPPSAAAPQPPSPAARPEPTTSPTTGTPAATDGPGATSADTPASLFPTGRPTTAPPAPGPTPIAPTVDDAGDGRPPANAAPLAESRPGGPPGDSEPTAPDHTRRPKGSSTKIICRIDHAALVRGHAEPGETCDIAGLGPIPVSAVKEMMNDAFLAAIVTNGVDVHTVAHLGRHPTAHQRTALEWRDPMCSNIACNNTRNLEKDHRTDWVVTHRTHLEDLDHLCPACHRLKTHKGWKLEPGTGRRRFLRPDEPDHPSNTVPPTPVDAGPRT